MKIIIILFLSLSTYATADRLYGGCYTFKYKSPNQTVCFISEKKTEENKIKLEEAKEEDLIYKQLDNVTSVEMLNKITTQRYKELWATHYNYIFTFQYKYNKGYIQLSGYGDKYMKAQIKTLEYEDEIYRIKHKLTKKTKNAPKKVLTNRENIMKLLNKEMNK